MDGSSPSVLFDFGYNSPVAPGAIGINLTRYTPAQGYGWITYGGGGSDSWNPDPLMQDSNWGTDNTFRVDLPNGTYSVSPIFQTISSQTGVIAEGQAVAASDLSNFSVQVTDGELSLEFLNYRLAGLAISGPNLSRISAGPDQSVNEGMPTYFTGRTLAEVGTTDTWDFGDGTTASGTVSPMHIYQKSGTYTVTFTATEPSGQVLKDTTQVTVNKATTQLFDFGYNSPVAPGAIGINLTRYTPAQGYGWITYGVGGSDSWNPDPLMQDSNWGTDNTFRVDLPNGTYSVSPIFQTISSQTGVIAEGQAVAASDLSNFSVQVTDGELSLEFLNYRLAGLAILATTPTLETGTPWVDAGPDQVVNEGASVQFSGQADSPTSPELLWDFGDGTSASGTLAPVHAYRDNGTYTVTLSETGPSGEVVKDTAQVTVNNVAPTPEIHGPYSGTTSGAVGFAASVTDPSSADTAAGFTYSWDFGDGTDGTGANPTHTYATPGTYTVSLTVRDKDGGWNTVHTSAEITAPVTDNSTIKTPFDTIPNFSANPTVTSIRSGTWSDPNTWSTGRVPTDGDIVSVAGGTVVTYDVVSTAHLDTVGIQAGGELDFRDDVNTEMIVANLMVLPGGTLHIGTTSAPIQAGVTAKVVFANKPLDLAVDPMQYGDGLIALGMVRMAGAEKTSFMDLAVEPRAGDTTLTFAQSVSGWQVGDRLYLPDTRQLRWNEKDSNYVSQNEHPVIAAISADGKTVTLASPLQYNHFGARDGGGVLDYLPQVADLTRNITFESEDPDGTRGHVMFTYRADVDVRYVGFTNVGRTLNSALDDTTFDSSGNVTHIGTNQMARYPFHLHHLIGPAQIPANGYQFTVIGNVMQDDGAPNSVKWGLVIHDSSYGLVQDNVVDNFAGAGIVTEAGTEIQNVIAHNFVAEIHGTGDRVDTEGVAGSGFWLHGPDNYVRDNVATNIRSDSGFGAYTYGYDLFAYYLGVKKVPAYQGADPSVPGQSIQMNMNATPLLEFSGNEVYGATSMGMTAWWIGAYGTTAFNDDRSVIKDLLVWNVYTSGYNGYPTHNLTIDGMVMRGDYDQYRNGTAANTGVYSSDYNQVGFVLTNSDIQGVATGFVPSFNSLGGEQVVENSYFRNLVDIAVTSLWTSSAWGEGIPARTTIIRNNKFNLDVPSGSNISPVAIGNYDYGNDTTQAYNIVQLDQVFVYDYNQVAGDDFQVYYLEQAPGFVMPASTYNPDGSVHYDGSPQAGLTNQQLWDLYHVSFAGAVSPTNKRRAGIHGFVQPI